jgi:pyruvate dehydrogenase E2 component (dihydrolipoamide acetyltransferase)
MMSTQILMPALSPTMEEGKLSKWHVKEGDTVKAGDILAEIETDKATMEFEAIDEGRIGKILVPEGAEGVKVNVPIAVLETEGEEAAPEDIPSTMKAIRDALAPVAKPETKSSLPQEGGVKQGNGAVALHTEQPAAAGARIFASPLAKRVAQASGVDLASLKGSGPRGRIVKADVEGAVHKTPSPPVGEGGPQGRKGGEPPRPVTMEAATAPAGIAALPDARLFYKEDDYEAVPNDSMRKTIARRLTAAKSLIPHYYLTIDCDIGALMQTRARLNDKSPKVEGAYKLSINDFVIKAAAMALMKHPDVNASWTEAAILKHKHADIGIAVDLNPGLITPIVFHAEDKGLVEISGEAKSLAERAKAKKLKPNEFEGGGFSISNLGMFGIKEFTALINPPQSAILAVGAGEERAVVRDGPIVAATMMTVTMSCDHRVIDGATGARFLQTLKSFIEEPSSMLL